MPRLAQMRHNPGTNTHTYVLHVCRDSCFVNNRVAAVNGLGPAISASRGGILRMIMSRYVLTED
jgi:hypothetical protein